MIVGRMMITNSVRSLPVSRSLNAGSDYGKVPDARTPPEDRCQPFWMMPPSMISAPLFTATVLVT